MLKTLLSLLVLGVLATTVSCGGGTSAGDKTKTAEAGKATTAATQPALAGKTATAVTQPTGTATDGTTINVAAKDFAFTLDKNSGPAGKFTFSVKNTGPAAHEFVVFKTDLPAGSLPLLADQPKVDEEGAGVTHVDEIGDLQVGDTKTLTIDLAPGAYVFVCNLPAHYGQGMYVAFKVQ